MLPTVPVLDLAVLLQPAAAAATSLSLAAQRLAVL